MTWSNIALPYTVGNPPDSDDPDVRLWRYQLHGLMDEIQRRSNGGPWVPHGTHSAAPAVTDDINDGYPVGYIWIHGTDVYCCTSNTAGAAVWLSLGGSNDATTGAVRGVTRSYKITTSPAVVTGMAPWCGFDACFETTPYTLAMASSAQAKVLIAERISGRWKVKPATETPAAGAYGIAYASPTLTGGGIVYVPLTAGGTHCGKFWCTSTASTNVTTIDPHNGFATATFSIGYSSVRGMQFDSHRNVVWALYNAGAPYQVLKIDMEGTVTDTDIYAGIGQWIAVHPTKIYIGAASGGYKLFEMDPSDMSQVDLAPAVTASNVHQMMYIDDLDILVCGEGDGNTDLFFYNCSDDTILGQTTVSGGLAYGSMGYVSELNAVVLGAWASGNNIVDIYSSANLAVDTAHMTFPRYFPETNEAIGHDNSTELLVYPFI